LIRNPQEVDMPELNRRRAIGALLQFTALVYPLGRALLAAVEVQPLAAQVKRLLDAMEYLGEPFSASERERLDTAANLSDQTRAIEEIQRVFDARCLFSVRINPESRVSVERGAAPARLVEQGWRSFLIKVRNEAGVTGVLNLESPQARPVFQPSTGAPIAPESVRPSDIADRRLELDNYAQKPMEPQLFGFFLAEDDVLVDSMRGRSSTWTRIRIKF